MRVLDHMAFACGICMEMLFLLEMLRDSFFGLIDSWVA